MQLRNRHLLVLDAVLLGVSPFVMYAIRFESWHWAQADLLTAAVFASIMLPIRLVTFYSFGLYSRLWRYASVTELELIFVAGVTASLISGLLGGLILPGLGLVPVRVPLSVLFSNSLLSILIIATPRFLMRMRGLRPRLQGGATVKGVRRRVLIAGAGAAGHMLARELRENPDLGLDPVGFIDDDPAKHNMRLSNLPVLGPLSMATSIIQARKIDELVIAMPTALGHVVRPLVRAALDSGIRTRTIPGFFEIVSGRVSIEALREVEIQDLLRREPVQTDLGRVAQLASGKVVLVTGAGGSIGSELARQLGDLAPRQLILLGHAENPIFYVQGELRAKHPGLEIIPIIADVRDRRRMFQVMEKYRPFAVFHAAAHKHVPLMEENVIEAVTNNVKGTQNLVHACVEAGVEHVVFISTDKAVRPTSVMGVTKRVAEHVVRQAAIENNKNYVAVRFGNVLGSEGSVLPTFLEQIKKGGPVTVTHPDMRRFFMTIPEAVQLVLQAGVIGRGGELFMLDMGEPVKIVDLAADLIRLSGFEVGTDIEIEFSGVRPGEKLFEEMFWGHEEASPTAHPKVLCARDTVDPSEGDAIEELIQATMREAGDDELRALLQRIVPDFTGYRHPTANASSFSADPTAPADERATTAKTDGGRRSAPRPLPKTPILPS
ncbi:MAG: polysaccharide biosynthesis protein CapD [Gemmatimonadetes bacterium]|nr:polysaccharide biosynthesis protein CapD [Gemmatimonadota bacterium]